MIYHAEFSKSAKFCKNPLQVRKKKWDPKLTKKCLPGASIAPWQVEGSYIFMSLQQILHIFRDDKWMRNSEKPDIGDW